MLERSIGLLVFALTLVAGGGAVATATPRTRYNGWGKCICLNNWQR